MSESKEEVIYPDVLQYVEIKPYKKHSATVIFLHGLGDSGNGMHRLVDPSLKWKSSEGLGHIKFIFPSAPLMSVTGNSGKVMPSWFDCYSFDIPNRAEDEEGLYRAVNWINKLISIEETEHNIPPNRIIIGGLSQGGAVSLLTTITIKKPLAGLFALSTYIPLRRKTPEILTPFAKQIPIFWGHGKKDLQVNHEFSIKCAETLATDLGVCFQSYEDVTLTRKEVENSSPEGLRFHSYGSLGHWVNERELEDLFVWILFLLPDIPKEILVHFLNT